MVWGVANAEMGPYHSVCLHIMHTKLLFFTDFYLRFFLRISFIAVVCAFEVECREKKTSVARYPII